jgi:hypothetical protein
MTLIWGALNEKASFFFHFIHGPHVVVHGVDGNCRHAVAIGTDWHG